MYPVLPPDKTIAFVSNSAWSVYNFRIDVIRFFIQQGMCIVVLAPDDSYSARLVAEGCRFIPIEFNNKGENPLKDYFFYRTLRKHYRRLRPDFIFHYVAKPNIYGSLAAAAEKIPCVAVITGLGYPFARRNRLFKVIRALYRKSLRHTREIWFLNNEDARVFSAEKIVSISKMRVLPGEGVNIEHFSIAALGLRNREGCGDTRRSLRKSPQQEELSCYQADQEGRLTRGPFLPPFTTPVTASPVITSPFTTPPPGNSSSPAGFRQGTDARSGQPGATGFRFLMSTRLLKSKGVSVYADAARILRKKKYVVHFSLIGFFEKNHPDSIPAEELLKWEEEGLVDYHGFADDVRPFLLQADCFVFPSFYNEGVPRCLMEAASMELPIITSLNRGCKEVVLNHSNGFICNPNDPFDLADKMEKMIQLSQAERCRMGKNSRELVLKKFAMTKVIREYTNILISAFER